MMERARLTEPTIPTGTYITTVDTLEHALARTEFPSSLDEDCVTCCSFCGERQHEVNKLIAGTAVFICDECVDLCVMTIAEMQDKDTSASWDQSDA